MMIAASHHPFAKLSERKNISDLTARESTASFVLVCAIMLCVILARRPFRNATWLNISFFPRA
jgi:hypothetical protein